MGVKKASETQVQPGDLVDLVRQLRRFARDFESYAFLIAGSFEAIGGTAEIAAAAARPLAQSAARQLYSLVEAVEKTPAYKNAKGKHEPR